MKGFCNRGHAERCDCVVVTSQPYGSPDNQFKGTVSENRPWISLFTEHFDTFTVFTKHLHWLHDPKIQPLECEHSHSLHRMLKLTILLYIISLPINWLIKKIIRNFAVYTTIWSAMTDDIRFQSPCHRWGVTSLPAHALLPRHPDSTCADRSALAVEQWPRRQRRLAGRSGAAGAA